jgi:hypothetical protein
MFDHHFHHRDDTNQFQQNIHTQLSSLNAEVDEDDDDGMALGDEAGVGLIGNMSDDDNNVSHSLNVSPTMDDDEDVPELVDRKPLQTPPLISPTKQTINSSIIDQSIAYTMNENYNRKDFSAISNNQPNDDYNDLYDNNRLTNNYSSFQQNSVSIHKSILIQSINFLIRYLQIHLKLMITMVIYLLNNNDHQLLIHRMIKYLIQIFVLPFKVGYVI